MGKIPVNVGHDGIDLMPFSGHKLYGPKGAGALYVRRRDPRVRLHAQLQGGGHEKGLRPGTLNVPGIVGLGKACALCAGEMQKDAARLGALRDELERSLLELPGVTVNGDKDSRLPHVSNLAFRQVAGNRLISELSREIAVSSGSACTSALPEPSHVLLAMGLDEELARASLRFSLGRMTTAEEIAFATTKVKEAVEDLWEVNASIHKI
jgi:cysteine desulfurase